MDEVDPRHRGHPRRRHRQRGRPRRPARARGASAPATASASAGRDYDWGCERYLETGAMMPEDGLDRLRAHEAIFLGAVGAPGVPDHVSLWGLLIPIRRTFEQYVNLRPIRLFDAVHSPLAHPPRIDLVVVRENVEGEYSEVGGRLYAGQEGELAAQLAVFTRRGTERVVRYAFALRDRAQRPARLGDEVQRDHPHHAVLGRGRRRGRRRAPRRRGRARPHRRAVRAGRPPAPESLDVIVGSNLFGDILSDLTAAVAGSIGIAPGGEPQPRARPPVDVRARARLGAGHRRAGDRQPDRPGLDRRADARAPRPPRGRRRRCTARSRPSSTTAPTTRPTSAAARPPSRSPPRSRRAGGLMLMRLLAALGVQRGRALRRRVGALRRHLRRRAGGRCSSRPPCSRS